MAILRSLLANIGRILYRIDKMNEYTNNIYLDISFYWFRFGARCGCENFENRFSENIEKYFVFFITCVNEHLLTK